MSRATIAVLLVLVAGLGFLAWRSAESPDQPGVEVPLFEHMEAARVTKVHVENIERAYETTFERDKDGHWLITDPIRVRANDGIVEQIVQSAVARPGTPVNEAEIDLKKLGLEPPHFVLVLFDDAGKRQQVDIGAVDPDQNRVNVLAHGKVLRAVRDFQVLLDLMPEDYQSHAATSIDPREVVEMHRRGSVYEPGAKEKTDLTLDALLEEGQWRATAPFVGALDPTAMEIVLRTTAGLNFQHYADNSDTPLAQLGLDPPDMTFELATLRGDTLTMMFGSEKIPTNDWWNGMTSKEKKVWRIPGDEALALALPITNLLDMRLHRFKQGDIDAVQLSTAEREVRLQKGVYGWTVAEAHAGSRVFGPALPADAKKVSDFLIALDKVEFSAIDAGKELGVDEGHDAIHVRAQQTSAGGTFGGPGDKGGVRFQRDNETVVGIVDESVRDLAKRTPEFFWSTSIVAITEVEAQRLTLRRGSEEVVFVRDRRGVWTREGRQDEARDLRPALDPLVFLRASAHVEPTREPGGDSTHEPHVDTTHEPHVDATHEALQDPIEVHWQLTATKKDLVIGILEKDGKRQVVCDFEGRRSVLQRQDLHALLSGLFQAPSGDAPKK